MGLDIQVGYFSNLLHQAPDEAEAFENELEILNIFLKSVSYCPHVEPKVCEVRSFRLSSYENLSRLRRLAAWFDLEGAPPSSTTNEANLESALERYIAHAVNEPDSKFLQSSPLPHGRGRTFDHLIIHSDCEGYYIPQDFEPVLICDNSVEIAGSGMIGSTHSLLKECRRIADAISLPPGLTPSSTSIKKAMRAKRGQAVWQRFETESLACLNLIAACEHSVKTGALMVYC